MKIYLFCNAGLSTSILVKNIKAEADKRGISLEIAAHPFAELSGLADGLDAALIGPQVGYRMNEARKICTEKNVPVEVIPMQMYGTCDGKGVLDFALNLINAG